MKKPKSRHISVRLGWQRAAMLDTMQRETGLSQGHIVGEAISALSGIVNGRGKLAISIFARTYREAKEVKRIRDDAEAQIKALRKGATTTATRPDKPIPAE